MSIPTTTHSFNPTHSHPTHPHPSQTPTHDITYLTKQNRKLRMQLSQVTKLKQLHQQVLIQINQQYPQSSIIKTLVSIINHLSIQQKQNKQNQYIIQLEGKMMVLEKIAQQTQQNQKQTYNLLAQEFQKLKQENTKISQQLHKFYQKIGQVDYISGLVTKYKQLILPTQQSMAFKKQQQQLLDALNLQQQMIKKISEEKDKLLKINVFMKQQVQRKKDQVRNMTMMFINGNGNQEHQEGWQLGGNVLDQLEEQKGDNKNNQQQSNTPALTQDNLHVPISQRSSMSTATKRISNTITNTPNTSRMNTTTLLSQSITNNNPNTTLNFIKLQRQLLKDVKQENESKSSFTNESQLSDCPQLSILFPDKVQRIIKTKQQAKVPYLNMKKVREMMAKREQKMRKQWQQQKNHMNPTTKIIQLQRQLQITRKQLSNQSLKYRLMQDELKRLRITIEEIQKRNELLVESNYRLKTNYQVVYKDYQLCKSITMEVQRALGMVVGRDNERKVKERLAVVLGNRVEEQMEQKRGNKNKNNRGDKQRLQQQQQQQEQQDNSNSLESTFRDQLRTKRFMEIFTKQKVKASQNSFRAYSK